MSRKNRIIAVLLLLLTGVIFFGSPYVEFVRLWFGVIGVDVSHHQGEIDWQKLAKTDVRFAYIKATEGGDYVDPMFKQNWDTARKAGLAVGAYHFFTRCKTGADQAKNFLATLPADVDALPPVLDAEKVEPCDSDAVELDPLKETQAFMDAVNAKLSCKPILYVSQEFDAAVLAGHFKDESFWVSSILAPPTFRRNSWKLWQYFDGGKRAGVNGPVDLDVFRGTMRDFENFRKASTCSKKASS
jgi:lysozyme